MNLRLLLLTASCLIISSLPGLAPAGEPLPAPQWIGLYDLKGKVGLRWAPDPRFSSVRVYRAEKGSAAPPLLLADVGDGQYIDEPADSGVTYNYFLHGVDAAGAEGPPSAVRSMTIARAVKKSVTAPVWEGYLLTDEGIGIKWRRRADEDILTYNVYRRREPDGELRLLASTSDSSYHDRSVDRKEAYAYVVRALDGMFLEGPPSEELLVAPTREEKKPEGKARIAWRVRRTRLLTVITETVPEQPLLRPADIAFNPYNSRMYVSDSGKRLVYVFSPEGSFEGALHGGQGGSWRNPLGLAVDAAGGVYGVDSARREVVVMPRGPGPVRRIDVGRLFPGEELGLIDAAVSREGLIFVVDNRNGRVAAIDDSGLLFAFGEAGSAPGLFSAPTFCVFDGRDHLYVSDALNGRVQVFDSQGAFVRSFGERRQGPGGLVRPKGIAVSGSGEVFVADSWQNVVQVFDGEGVFVAFLADEEGRLLDLGSPNGVAFDDRGRLWIAERLSGRVQVREIMDDR